jgi:choice-of-anchor C domain-containing protein
MEPVGVIVKPRERSVKAVACCWVWFVLAVPVAYAQDTKSLIVNGSFEEGPAVRLFLNLREGDTSLPGWVVTGEGIDYVAGDYWVSSRSARAIDLDGSARSRKTPPYVQGGIAQTFPTVVGTRYRVTFDLAGNPNQLPRVKPLRVSAAGETVDFTFDSTGKTGRDMGWTPKSWAFTATGTTTTLEFRSLTVSPQTGFGAAIDNVVVIAEPAVSLDIRESEKEIQIQLGSEVLFDTGRFDLKPAATEALLGAAKLLSQYPDAPVVIEGHTDSLGTAQSNQTLSENRAAAVREWLIANGVRAGRVTAKGLGPTVPVASNDTAEGRQRNRRVEIRLQKTSPPPR